MFFKEVHVWNPTVANLTLMALGSSAPEILLSIIEIVGKNFKAGELGPSTIVGKLCLATKIASWNSVRIIVISILVQESTFYSTSVIENFCSDLPSLHLSFYSYASSPTRGLPRNGFVPLSIKLSAVFCGAVSFHLND